MIIDARWIVPPLRSPVTYDGVVILSPAADMANRLLNNGVRKLIDLPTPLNLPNLIVSNSDAMMACGLEGRVLKIVDAYPTVIIERFYLVPSSKHQGALFRVRYRPQNNIRNLKLPLIGKSLPFTMDIPSALLLHAAQSRLAREDFAELLLSVTTWCRAMNVHFSPIVTTEQCIHLIRILMDRLKPTGIQQDWKSVFTHLIKGGVNYRSFDPADPISGRHSLQSTIPINQMMGGFMGTCVDSSPCLPLWRSGFAKDAVNNLYVFGQGINALEEWRYTDYRVSMRYEPGFFQGATVEKLRFEYQVDRLAAFNPINSPNAHGQPAYVFPMAMDLLMHAFATGFGYDSGPTQSAHYTPFSAYDVTVTRNYDEEILVEFKDDSGKVFPFYFDLNACVLLSPENCANTFRNQSLYDRIGTDVRDADLWI